MRWLVDGMNLMGSRPDGWWRDRVAGRRRLVADLAAFGRRPDVEEVVAVFDGRHRADEVDDAAAHGVRMVFAPGGPNAADHVIAAMARDCPAPGELTVVTSDGALGATVLTAGVEVLGVRAFRRLLGATAG